MSESRGHNILLELKLAPVAWTAKILSRFVMATIEELLRRHPTLIPPPIKMPWEKSAPYVEQL